VNELSRIAAMLALGADDAAAAERSLWDYIRAGHFVGYVLIAISFLAVALVVRYFIEVKRASVCPPEAADELLARVRAGNPEAAREYCAQAQPSSFLTRVVGSALTRSSQSPFGMLEVRSAMEEAGQRELDRLYRTTDGIGLIAAVGPMLGLLGTVFGMIGAFGQIGGEMGAARSTKLADYMSIALVTTAEGLIVAIPCTMAYALFRRRIESLVSEASEVTEQIASFLERGADAGAERGVTADRPAAPPARPPAPRPAAPAPPAAPVPAAPDRGARAS